MKLRHQNKMRAFTLVECLVVMLILMVTFGGVIGFRYFSILSAERAETQLLAARAAVVISEAWRAQKGATDFDPTQQGFDDYFQILPAGSVLAFMGTLPSGSLLLGDYQVEIEGRQFRAKLMYENAAGVPNARLLYVVMNWQDRKQLRQQFCLSTLTQT
ncbi:MAG: prepilin-type N-terminal cleavage/methylation domain-containing protein [Phycisphaerae bacterium]|nr:prepilin-type N-terminal cleavage/methylation domain-containing protein [Phycisphaerae bacterium]